MTEAGGTLPPTGSEMITTYVTASAQTIPSNDAQKLIYKRLYHNLPYLLKKKGTTAGLRVLLNCFGIPDTILRISEFGGKDKNVNTWDYWYNQFNYTYNTSGSGYIQTPWEGSDFISTWTATSNITLPLTPGGTYDMTVDWGDGTSIDTITAWNASAKTHTYASAGNYDVKIKGTIKGFSFNNLGDKEKLVNVTEWGPLQLCESASFYGSNNLTVTAQDRPAILTTTLEDTFRDASSINTGISNWKTPNVTNLKNTFRDATGLNSTLNWDTTNVTNLEETFKGAINFNQPVPWSTSAATSVSGAFSGATLFNQPLDLDLSACSNFAFMFEDAVSLDSPINLITTIGGTFRGIFKGARIFNQDISTFDFSGAIDFESMFEGALLFNMPPTIWNTANVATMIKMFFGATAFDQDISMWNISSLTDAANMFDGSGLTTPNYDALLQGWAAQAPAIQSNVSLGAAGIQFTNATSLTAHNILTSPPYSWTISDGGGI